MDRFLRHEIIQKVLTVWHRVRQMEVSVHSAHACYFLILSAFPTLVLLLGLLRYTTLEAADLMDFLAGFLPTALQPYAWDLISATYANTSRAVLSASAVTALWSAGRGIYGLVRGLNAVYGVQTRRRWLQTRLMCAVYMVLFLLVVLLTLVVHVFGNTIVAYLSHHGGLPIWPELVNLRIFPLAAVQTLLFCAMFMYLPGRRNGFRESLPGALFAGLGWMAVSGLFSLYVERGAGYSSIFGSVYAVALSMLWLYLCVSMVFFGAVLNRLLVKKL